MFLVFAALAHGQPIPDPREEGYEDDQALYQAKSTGRARSVLADSAESE